jgi:hypothetical protein
MNWLDGAIAELGRDANLLITGAGATRYPRERRLPRARESVLIHNFWAKDVVFHARWDPGTICEPDREGQGCGHALPIERARLIARPCRRCYLPPDDREVTSA